MGEGVGVTLGVIVGVDSGIWRKGWVRELRCRWEAGTAQAEGEGQCEQQGEDGGHGVGRVYQNPGRKPMTSHPSVVQAYQWCIRDPRSSRPRYVYEPRRGRLETERMEYLDQILLGDCEEVLRDAPQ